MKSSRVWIGVSFLLLIAALAAGAVLWLRGDEEPSTWTTSSPRAREELELALEDLQKVSQAEAVRHLERALELDPDLVIARFYLQLFRRGEEQQRLRDELLAVDLGDLSPKERFLLGYFRARWQGRDDEADRILERYLAARPEDADALDIRCGLLWQREDLAAAEACYRRLIEVHPNWVLGQNRLGYLAMSRERFAEAEERFRTYRYIAPGLPDPHDSLGDLLTLLGRYEEAEQSFERALALEPDFCASYLHLALLGLHSGRWRLVEDSAARLEAREACGEHRLRGQGCWLRAAVLYQRGELEAAWARVRDLCLPEHGPGRSLAYRLALAAGRRQQAEPWLEHLRGEIEESGPRERAFLSATLLHMEALGLLDEGRAAAAAEKLQQADLLLAFNGIEQGHAKLEVRLALHRTLELAGEAEAAGEVLASVARINPTFAETYRLPDLEALGEPRP